MQAFKILKTDYEEALWSIPPALAKKLGLKKNQIVLLKCGAISIEAKVMINQLKQETIEEIGLSPSLLKELKLPNGQCISIKPVGNGLFQLGPVIGILTFQHIIAKKHFSQPSKYGKIINRYASYAKRLKGIGLFYVFGPNDIYPEKKAIKGYLFNHEKQSWQKGIFPYPDAVMDRTYPNKYTAHKKLEKEMGPKKIFNKTTLINKIEFNNILSHDSLLKHFIPETILFEDKMNLKEFLSRYPRVFLKPFDSMKGNGIVYIIPNDNRLLCRYMQGKKPMSKIITEPDQISHIFKSLNTSKRTYIMQAAIERMTFQKSFFDLRVMVTKDGTGQWSVPAIFVRVSPPNAFLTNRSQGADYLLLDHLLEKIKNKLPYSRKQFFELLTDLSIETAIVLDKEFGPLGKLGIDIVLDITGKPWLIEANGNPGWICPNGQTEFPLWHSQIFDLPIAYALYLTGFNET